MRNTKKAVVLVPVGGTIVPDCDRALQVLQGRGYEVRTVRGFSQVDVGRCQMATDALGDGFEELIWIDSDVGFDPDDIERLREHNVPFVCGIYPKKGLREFACNYLPGTDHLMMGAAGGLNELLYAGFGFNYTHRSVYETVQKQLNLPICNEQFGSPLIPYFMPMVVDGPDGPWYLGEDYAFCERARQCGFKIHVDTRIRLWHIGTYRYSWEDAGGQLERFDTYHFTTGIRWSGPRKEADASGSDRFMPSQVAPAEAGAWNRLQAEFPWPKEMPAVVPNRRHGWLTDSVRTLLGQQLADEAGVIVELGAWLGMSTRFILNRHPLARVISVDLWQGSPEHQDVPETARLLPRLFDTYLANCWSYRNRLLPLRKNTLEGLRWISAAGIQPQLIYLDADHSYEAVKADLELSLKLFPEAVIVGDDWDWEGVRQAAEAVATARGLRIHSLGNAWQIVKS